jgi:hypothetical protein
MTGRQEYDRTKDRQRILGKYMIDCGEQLENIGFQVVSALTKTAGNYCTPNL